MKKLLVVVDYQVDFVNGALGFENADKLDSVIANKIKQYRQENNDVIFTFFIPVHPSNASLAIDLILSGILISVILLQFSKNPYGISVAL